MLNVSQAYKDAIKAPGRVFSWAVYQNGEQLSDARITDIQIEEAGFSQGALCIGEYCRNSISITANMGGDTLWHKNDTVYVEMTIEGAEDVVPLGFFWVTSVTRVNDYSIRIFGYDSPVAMTETFVPATVPSDVALNIANIELATGMSLTNMSLLTTTTAAISDGLEFTNADYLRYVAGLDGYNIRADRQGDIELYKVTYPSEEPYYVDTIDVNNILEEGLSVNDNATTIQSFVITAGDGYEYKAGTDGAYGINYSNPLATETTDFTKMTGYLGKSYYACAVTFRGDPSYQMGDIVGLPQGDTYVPCIVMRQSFRIDGGLSSVMQSMTNETTPESPTQKKINEVKQTVDVAKRLAEEAQTVSESVNQHFWHRDTDPEYDGAGTGAFVTDEEKDTFLDAMAHDVQPTTSRPLHNLLMNAEGILLRAAKRIRAAFTPSGVAFYDGEGNAASNVVAAFGSDGAQIGRSDENNIRIDSDSLDINKSSDILASFSPSRMYMAMPTARETIDSDIYFNVSKGASTTQSPTRQTSDIAPNSEVTVLLPTALIKMGTFIELDPLRAVSFVDDSLVADAGIYTGDVTMSVSSGSETLIEGALTTQGEYSYYGITITYSTDSITIHNSSSSRTVKAIVYFAYFETLSRFQFGTQLLAEYDGQTVIGKYNDNQSDTAFEIGNGTASARSNAFTVDWDGNVEAAGKLYSNGTQVSLQGHTHTATEVEPFSAMTARLVGQTNVNLTTSYQNVSLENSTSVGSDITISNGAVRCAKAGKVMLSAAAFFTGMPNGNVCNLKVIRGTTDAAFASDRCVTDRCQLTLPSRITTCAAGDVFRLAVSCQVASGQVAGSGIRTWLTVQYVDQ